MLTNLDKKKYFTKKNNNESLYQGVISHINVLALYGRAYIMCVETKNMGTLLTIGIILLVLWLFGLISSNTFGGGIHLLLVVAIILFVLGLIL